MFWGALGRQMPLEWGWLPPHLPPGLQPNPRLSCPGWTKGQAGGKCFASSLAARLIGERVISPGARMI